MRLSTGGISLSGSFGNLTHYYLSPMGMDSIRGLSMDYKEYREKFKALDAEMAKLKELKDSVKDKVVELDNLYIAEYGYLVGTAVKVNDNTTPIKFHVSEANIWGDRVVMTIRKAKKDGQPAMTGATRYSMSKDDLKLWSDDVEG